jgi:hypothetical protein
MTAIETEAMKQLINNLTDKKLKSSKDDINSLYTSLPSPTPCFFKLKTPLLNSNKYLFEFNFLTKLEL